MIFTKLKRTLFIITLIISSLNLYSKDLMKFGKPTPEEFEMKVCPIDSNASAVVLGGLGTTKFRFTEDNTFIDYTYHIRIKILGKESLDKGNFIIKLYKSDNGDEEKITKTKGLVFNKVDGQWEKSKLTNKNIFKDEYDKNHDMVKVVMPDVKVGSIIEFEYDIESPYLYHPKPWYFQSDIPTLQSEYNIYNIEWFNYKNWVDGYIMVNKQEETKKESFSFRKSTTIEPGAGGGRKSGEFVNFDAFVNHWTYTAKNVPAFKDEPFITVDDDYLSSVNLELQSVNYPWAPMEYYTSTWKKVSYRLLDNTYFGRTLKFDGHLKDVANLINSTTQNPIQKASMAYYHIKNTIAWNGYYSKYADKSIREAYNSGEGCSGDINLNLIALCRLLDLNAEPVIISTRNNKKVRKGIVSSAQFNSTIAAVKINDNYLLMDASVKSIPFGLLPPNDLNGIGRLITEGEGKWIDLYSTKPFKEYYMLNLSYSDNNTLTGTLSYRASDYAAFDFRNKLKSAESEEKYMQKFEKSLNGFKITEYTIKDLDSLQKPVTLAAKIELKEALNSINNMIYFSPKLIKSREENVFKAETREYPIDRNYPIYETVSIAINFPENYTIEEIPKPLIMTLPENKGKYVYSVSKLGNKLQLTNQYLTNTTVFPGYEYQNLKQFHDNISGKESEQVVLKKL